MRKYTILITNILSIICLIIGLLNFKLLIPALLFTLVLWKIQKNYKEEECNKN